jgi:hypothetical protein
MRCIFAFAIAAFALLTPAAAAPPSFDSTEAILRWVNGYRLKPEPMRVPDAVRALSRAGALRDPENAGVYVGFVAGVLGSNPARADDIVKKMFPLPAEDQWIVVRAIAYSGLRDWKGVLRRATERMPTRARMIEKYLTDKSPTLDQLRVADPPSLMDRLRDNLSINPKPEPAVTLEVTPEVVDTLWGYYFGSRAQRPVARIVSILPWSKEKDSVDRVTVGNIAKYTLAGNASRDADLLGMLKQMAKHQPQKVVPILEETIEAAETAETGKLRKAALDGIDELKRRGPNYKREVSWWGQIGQGALAAGCVAAAVTGHIELGLPCVIGGGLSTAGLQLWSSQ